MRSIESNINFFSFRVVLTFIFIGLTQVAKIKSDEREDLKVLATGVAAALAARKVRVMD